MKVQKIHPCLWFDDNAEAAVNDYCQVFKHSGVDTVSRYSERQAKVSQRPAGSVMAIGFHLEGQNFLAINGGPIFKLTPAISFVVNCETQAEIDSIWNKLVSGGQAMPCGWLTDKYGVSWQVVPASIASMMQSGTPTQIESMMQAMMPMTKLDMAVLQKAFENTR